MEFVIKNRKRNTIVRMDEYDVIKNFEVGADNFFSCNCTRDDYETAVQVLLEDEETTEEEVKNFIELWQDNFHHIYYSKTEYLKALIEFELWTSPRGIEKLYEVLAIAE